MLSFLALFATICIAMFWVPPPPPPPPAAERCAQTHSVGCPMLTTRDSLPGRRRLVVHTPRRRPRPHLRQPAWTGCPLKALGRRLQRPTNSRDATHAPNLPPLRNARSFVRCRDCEEPALDDAVLIPRSNGSKGLDPSECLISLKGVAMNGCFRPPPSLPYLLDTSRQSLPY